MKNSRSPISEQYRTIRTNIEYASVDQEMKSIMVTSAGPGEGKSTTVANLAVVFAQQGKKVLLVDADLRKPTVQYTFRADSTYGLTNLLTKQKSPQQTIQQSQVENLSILPSGPIPPNPAELLGSNAMKGLMEYLSQEYDIILFDVPPVLAVTDAQVLANECDGVILVVQSGGTDVDASKKAKEALLNAKGKLLGVVLNQKKMKKGDYHYYYYETK
ncbi:MAG: CpsD/CapB family tyrosine-protein kinase [Bacillaceae bacterium]|nr:CpsD/CapB family tyrosine-protein kinase [Bacillaceae bacterium]